MEIVIVLYFLLAALAAPFFFVNLRRARHREQTLLQKNARLERALAEQRAKSEDLLDALKVKQQGPKEVTLPSEKREASWHQQMEEELSKISCALATLAESIEAKPHISASDKVRPEQDWLANLPLEPEARLTTLEERKSALQQRRRELRIVLRDCNREISYARRALLDTGVETQETLSLDAFTGILPEDYERELLRLILRENGRPDSESIRLVLGDRFPHAVRDEINGRSYDVLGDILLYEEEERLVVTEEFVDDLRSFLNDRAVPARRV